MIKLIMGLYFKDSKCLVSSLIEHIETPQNRVRQLISTLYRGQSNSPFTSLVSKGMADGPLLINTVKMYHSEDYKSFFVLGRVLSGKIKTKDNLKIMG